MSTPAIGTDRVRLIALMYPKEGVAFEDFDRYWLTEHSKIFTSLAIVKKNLVKYEQFHFLPEVNKAIAAQGAPAAPFFGMAIFEAESMDKIMEVFTDDEYFKVVVPDEESFFDRSKSQMIAGQRALILGS